MSNEVFCYVDKKAIRLPITIEQVFIDWKISAVDIKPELNIKKSDGLLNRIMEIIQKMKLHLKHHFGQFLQIVLIKHIST